MYVAHPCEKNLNNLKSFEYLTSAQRKGSKIKIGEGQRAGSLSHRNSRYFSYISFTKC